LSEKAIGYGMIILALIGMLGPVLLKRYNLSLLGSYLGIPMILAPATWVRVKGNRPRIFVIQLDAIYLLGIAYFLCYGVSILILDFFPLRNIGYYFLITLMATSILCQILFSSELKGKNSLLILTEIGLLMLNLIWGVNLKYHYFIGRTDTLVHSWLAQNLIDTGHITSVFEHYEAFPLWHILCTAAHKICDLSWPPHTTMFLINGVVYFFLIIAVYLTVATLLNNEKLALLSALFTCINPEVIFYGMYSIPRSAVFFLEVLLIYFLLQKRGPKVVALSIFFSFAMVMYHTASMPFVVVILLAIYFLQKFFKIRKNKYVINLNYLLLLMVLTVTYWFYFGEQVFRSLARHIFSPAPIGPITKAVINTPLNELFNYIQYSPLLFFIICGVLFIVPSKRSNRVSKLFFVAALGLTFVTLPGPSLLINKLAGNFNLGRFGEYSFFFICMAAGTGLYALFLKAKGHRPGIVLLFVIMVFLSVSNDFTASDSPLVKRPFYTFYFTENETAAIDRLARITKGYLMADHPAHKYLVCTEYANKAHILEVSGKNKSILTNSKNDLVIVRERELGQRPLKLFTVPEGEFRFDPTLNESQDYYYQDSPVWSTAETLNKIYDSGAVRAVN